MSENRINLKFNISYLKWVLICLFLVFIIIPLFALGRTDDKTFIIIYEISMVCLSVFSFVMLSIFPRLYYIIDEKGVSFQNKKGKERNYITWDCVVDINYIFNLGIIPEGMELKWQDGIKIKTFVIIISPKQARLVYNSIDQVRILVDKSPKGFDA